jgi:hypothetical protein
MGDCGEQIEEMREMESSLLGLSGSTAISSAAPGHRYWGVNGEPQGDSEMDTVLHRCSLLFLFNVLSIQPMFQI